MIQTVEADTGLTTGTMLLVTGDFCRETGHERNGSRECMERVFTLLASRIGPLRHTLAGTLH